MGIEYDKMFFVDIENKTKNGESAIGSEEKSFTIKGKTHREKLAIDYKKIIEEDALGIVSDEDLKKINGLNRNGPLRKLTNDDIQTRAMIIMGEEPTSKMSIHPEGNLNGKDVRTLTKLAKLLPGSPMMIGHRMDKSPWGRTYDTEIINGLKGYSGAVLKEKYWFVNDIEGISIAKKIDCGIWAEGSISYWFKEARCSICHKTMASYGEYREALCVHEIGKKDKNTGQICYWYPYNIQKIAETSVVFCGAYGKTRSMLSAVNSDLIAYGYGDEEIKAGVALEKQFKENYGFEFKKEITKEKGEYYENDKNRSTIPPEVGSNEQNSSNQSNEHLPQIIAKNDSKGKCDKEKIGNENNQNGKNEKNSQPKNSGSYNSNDKSTEGNEPGNKTKSDGDNPVAAKNINSSSLNNSENKKSENDKKSDGEQTKGNLYQTNENKNYELKESHETRAKLEKEPETNTSIGESDTRLKESGLENSPGEGNSMKQTKDPEEEKKVQTFTTRHEEIMEIFNDSELDNDEKETSFSEMINEGKMDITTKEMFQYCEKGKETIDEGLKSVELVGLICAENKECLKKEDFRDLPKGVYHVEPMYDGVWFELHKNSGTVKLISTNKVDYSKKFPGIVKEAKEIKADNIVVIGELVKFHGRKRGTKADVMNWLEKEQETYEDKSFKYKTNRIIVENGIDISTEALKITRKKLEENIPNGKQIQLVTCKIVEHVPGSGKIEEAIEDKKTREGSKITNSLSRYCIEDIRMMYEWKQQEEIKEIKEINEISIIKNKKEKKDSFVIQNHGWGKCEHWDIRLNDINKNIVYGWTCFSEIPKEIGTQKTRCQEKKVHEEKWMSVNKKTIRPGEDGNPTEDKKAWMTICDSGECTFIKNTDAFIEIELKGKEYHGRYVWRKIEINQSSQTAEQHTINGDEVSVKNKKIWIISKPKDQTISGKVKKIKYQMIGKCLSYWETDEDDDSIK